MVFNPTLESNIGFEEAVQQPSALGAIAGLADNLGLFNQPKERKEPSAESRKDEARRFYFSEWDRGQQLIEQGRVTEGKSVIASAYRGWASAYGPGTDEEVDKSYESSFGASVQTTQFGTASDMTAIRSTPDYSLNVELVRASNPELDEFSIEQEATRLTQNKMANDAKINTYKQDQSVTWVQAERAYTEGAQLLGSTVQTMIANINEDSIITPEEAKMFRDWYGREKQKFSPPPGVADTDWKSFNDNRLAPIDEVVNASIGITQEGGANSDMSRALTQILDKAILQGKLPPALRIQLTPNADGSYQDPLKILASMADTGQFGERWTESINSALSMSYEEMLDWVTDFENKDASFLDRVDTSEFDGLSDSDKVASLKQASIALSDNADLGKAAERMITIVENVGSLTSKSVDANLLGQVFNNSFYNKLGDIYEANPVVGEAIVERTEAALAAQETALILATESVASQYGWRLQKVNGKFDFVPDPKTMPPAAIEELNKYFDGDWGKAIRAKGILPLPTSVPGGMGAVAQRQGAIAFALKSIDRFRPNIDKFNSVMKTRERLKEFMPVTGEGQDTVQGGAGADTLSVSSSNVQSSNGPIAQSLGIDFEGVELMYNLPAGYLERTAYIESTGNPNAQNPESSAGGLFQQLDSNARDYGVKNKFDPVQSTEGAARFAADNIKILRGVLGRDPTGAELYLAHQQGGSGAASLLSNPDVPAVNIVGADAVRLNGGDLNMTAGQFANIWISKYNGGRGPTSYTQATGKPPMAAQQPPMRRPEATTPETTAQAVGGTVQPIEGAKDTTPMETSPRPQERPESASGGTRKVTVQPVSKEVADLIEALVSGGKLKSGDKVKLGDQEIEVA